MVTADPSPSPPAGAPAAPAPTPAADLPEPHPGELHAWSRSVSEEERRAADELFQQGNAFMRDSVCISAAAKYREALGHWDHPNIHYNLAIALLALDQPVETYEHLQAAVRFGPEPLQQDRYQHARNYLALLENQLTRVTFRCDVPGAIVELDGHAIFVAPGEHQALVRAGSHNVVASREGLVTNRSVRVFEGGKATLVELRLHSVRELTELHRRWRPWVPWTMIGAGLAVVAAGGGVQYLGQDKIRTVDEQSKLRCPNGCSAEPADLASARRQGASYQRIASGVYAAGGALVVAGGVLAYLNRTEVRVRSYESDPDAPASPERTSLELRPAITPGGASLAVALRF
jgi:hypothetical protein